MDQDLGDDMRDALKEFAPTPISVKMGGKGSQRNYADISGGGKIRKHTVCGDG